MQLLKYSENLTKGRAGQILNMDNFIDTSNIEGRFEFSEWVRAYGKYLDEQLDVYSKISFYQVGQDTVCGIPAASASWSSLVCGMPPHRCRWASIQSCAVCTAGLFWVQHSRVLLNAGHRCTAWAPQASSEQPCLGSY